MNEQELKDELKAQKIYELAKLEQEFESLRNDNSLKNNIVPTLGIAIVCITPVAFPSIFQESINTVWLGLVAVLFIGARLEHRVSKLDKRINIMYKLFREKS